jgi:hypothetical protein
MSEYAYVRDSQDELKETGVQVWQREWDASHKVESTKTFFSSVKDRTSKRLQMCINL